MSAVLTAPASVLAQAAPTHPDQAPIDTVQPGPRGETQIVHLNDNSLPDVNLTGDIFYRDLLGEIQAQRGNYAEGGSTMLGLARDTTDPRFARRALEFFLSGNDFTDALAAAHQWAQLAPYDNEAVSTEFALAAASGQVQGLGPALRAKIDAASNKDQAIAQSYAVLSRMTDKKRALGLLKEAVADSLGLSSAHLALSDMSGLAGDNNQATAEARQALALAPDSSAAALRLLRYGLQSSDPASAVADVRSYLAKHPAARELRLALVSYLAKNGQYDQAIGELQAMERAAPEDFDLLFFEAQVEAQAHSWTRARAVLQQFLDVQNQRAKALQPGTSDAEASVDDAHALMASIDENQGDYDGAIAELNLITEPNLIYPVRLRQAQLRAREGRIDDALRMIDAATPSDDDDRVSGVLAKVDILRTAKRDQQAISVLEKANQTLPDTPEIKYELAMLYAQQNRYPEMEQLLRQVIALQPDSSQAYNALGYTYADLNQRLPEAEQLVQHALTLSPNDPFIMDSMGWVQYRLGHNDTAVAYLQRAMAVRPEADIGSHLGEVLWVMGRKDDAIKVFRQAASIDPNNTTLAATLKRLGVSL